MLYRQKMATEWKRNGLCLQCGKKPIVAGKTKCIDCAKAYKIYDRTAKRKRKLNNKCGMCGSGRPRNSSLSTCDKCIRVTKYSQRLMWG